MTKFSLPKIYPITDVRLSSLSHAEQIIHLIEGGATLVQLREKHMSPREFYKEAAQALTLAHQHGIKVLINDRVDIAMALKADGVHLGQDDLAPEAARRLLGDQSIIGFSTHNVEQAIEASSMPVDYIAIGPIFKTTSKEKADPVVGLEGLREVRFRIGDKPLVAIGGISYENAPYVFNAGADSIAVINSVLAEDPKNISLNLKRLMSLV
jgi:thiamine-phosphate pyrophosphorylase